MGASIVVRLRPDALALTARIGFSADSQWPALAWISGLFDLGPVRV
jgi:hypothetical protein